MKNVKIEQVKKELYQFERDIGFAPECTDLEIISVVVNALNNAKEKLIPRKAKTNDYDVSWCPSCGKLLNYVKWKNNYYCLDCGQKMDSVEANNV